MKKILFFPYNGNAMEAIECLDDNWEFIGFIDDNLFKLKKSYDGHPIYSRSVLDKYLESNILAVYGGPKTYINRKRVIESLNIPEERFATIIHPKALISNNVTVGKNTLIMGGVVVTSNAIIGNHVVILPNSVIHHDTVINDYSLVGSGVVISGNVTINNNCYIGSGSKIKNHLSIGSNTLVGIGSNVTNNFSDNLTIIGNPAKEK